ncbi:hypothetical protein P5G51_016800 [Virgibacillus sp. 179-BFC.A HS]|uniref:Uncharacterized protein n=1 Tax=Tigheibacillus jepli TaxID=3035914 RepID=A0ABU5CLV3_9BACI|nr:hypothetical protein [Virgibacillus sp. 179-BFC.A HS]MDY0406797.1 hypothetical protein [Virgibacillus sp. 179-BFC.A HS]
MLRFLMELIRIICIFFLGGIILSVIANSLYAAFGVIIQNTNRGWLVGISILLLLFVWYRNRLQFTGFYRSKRQVKLPKAATWSIVTSASVLLIAVPFV